MSDSQKPPQDHGASPDPAPVYSQVPVQKSPMAMADSGPAMMSLYEARGWIKFIGWMYIIGGILYALTCVGILLAWLPIWMGVCLKNSAENLEMGMQHQNSANLKIGADNLATFFKIIGVCSIIALVFSLGYVAIIAVMIFGGALAM